MNEVRARIGFPAIASAAIASVLFSCLAAPERAAARSVPNAPQVRDFDLRYRTTGEGGPGQIHLQFAAHDRWRIERRDRETDEAVVAAGVSVFTYDRTTRVVLWQARDQAQPYCDLGIDLGARAPGWEGAARKRLEEPGSARLADESVLGRSCLVYTLKYNLPAIAPPLAAALSSKLWVDKQLLIPLRVEEYVDDSLNKRVEAESVRVNQGVSESSFRFQRPRGVRIFKGGLTSVPDPQLLRGAAGEGYGSQVDFSWSGQAGKATTFYAPEYVPNGFRVVSTSGGVGETSFRAELASGAGATIVFEESCDPKANPLPGLPWTSRVAIGSVTGESGERYKPFHRIVLTWQVADCHMRIDAAEVPKSEVVRMAASVRERAATPVNEVRVRDAAEAQAKVNFLVLVLVPQALPEGWRLLSGVVFPHEKRDGSETPEQVSLSYWCQGGETVNLSEMAGVLGTISDGWERVTIAGHPGWHKYDKRFGHHLYWDQDGTEIQMTSRLSKGRLLAIAASLAPADPSARERVKQYQEQHPQSDSGPEGAQEFADALTAQAQVNFLVLVPKPLPKGFTPVDITVTPYSKQGSEKDYTETPEQISMAYTNLLGDMFSLLEMRASGLGRQWTGAERITISGHAGWYKYDADMGHRFDWQQEGTGVTLSGKLPKAEMLRIAQSLAAADASARERVKKYQAEHRNPFGAFGEN